MVAGYDGIEEMLAVFISENKKLFSGLYSMRLIRNRNREIEPIL
jgi:hypothetical protein